MDSKSGGYLLLGAGLIIMVFALIQVVLAFTNITQPSYFKSESFSTKSAPPPTLKLPSSVGELDQGQLTQMISGNLLSGSNIIPAGVLDNAINLSAHFFLMTFIGGFGHKLAMMGINLIRPIVIKTGDKTIPTVPQ